MPSTCWTRLLLSSTTRIGVENPCFREAINTFLLADAEVVPHPVDEEGIVLNERPCDYYYVTPGHQVPTGVTMSSARRRQLLEHAARHDAVIIEDDYDSESNFTLNPLPALKASDRSGRVVYVSSLSKALSPGLRLGFMVADPDLIDEARALRRLVYRHPPTNIQYQMAHFLPRAIMRPICGATTMTPPSAGSVCACRPAALSAVVSRAGGERTC